MPPRAHVTSVAAIEDFRANRLVYLSKARPVMDEVGSEVTRLRIWLQQDQPRFWESQIRRRSQDVQEAQQAVFTASIATYRRDPVPTQLALRKAKQLLEEADTKLRRVKKWSNNFDSELSPLARQLERLNSLLANNLPQAVAGLAQTINTLHAYSEVGQLPAAPATAPPPSTDNPAATPAETTSTPTTP